MSTHLVTGVGGQDGTLLATSLIKAGHRVWGTWFGAPTVLPGATLRELDITDPAAFAALVADIRPDVIHNFAGLSSVSQSWAEPELSDRVNRLAVLDMLATLEEHPQIHFIQASSAEIFGAGPGTAAESTPIHPLSPYAEAKAAAHLAVQRARAGGRRASNIVLFGHTSPRQPARFALASVCRGAAAIAAGTTGRLEVQNPLVRRDWGSARDHVRAFALAADTEPDDHVIGTGQLTQLGEVIEWALAAAGVPDAEVVVTGTERPHDHDGLVADFSRARDLLGWEPTVSLQSEIESMVRSAMGR